MNQIRALRPGQLGRAGTKITPDHVFETENPLNNILAWTVRIPRVFKPFKRASNHEGAVLFRSMGSSGGLIAWSKGLQTTQFLGLGRRLKLRAESRLSGGCCLLLFPWSLALWVFVGLGASGFYSDSSPCRHDYLLGVPPAPAFNKAS